jgi:hypothetical protein
VSRAKEAERKERGSLHPWVGMSIRESQRSRAAVLGFAALTPTYAVWLSPPFAHVTPTQTVRPERSRKAAKSKGWREASAPWLAHGL